MQKMWIQLLGQEDPLEKAMAPHSSTLAWKIPWMEEPGRLRSMGSLRVRHDWVTSLSLFTFTLEKEMATHSSVLAWRIQGTGEPGGYRLWVTQSRTRLKWLSIAYHSIWVQSLCSEHLFCPYKRALKIWSLMCKEFALHLTHFSNWFKVMGLLIKIFYFSYIPGPYLKHLLI